MGITLEEVKLRALRRLENTPLVTWPVLRNGMSKGLASAELVRDAVNSLAQDGKVSLLRGKNGGVYVALAEYAQGIDCARFAERVE